MNGKMAKEVNPDAIWAQKDGYLVHRDGSVYSINWHNSRRMRQVGDHINNNGYCTFYNKRRKRVMLVSRFVAECFLPNPENLPQVNHKNEIKTDNRVENLEWCDNRHNVNWGTHNERMAASLRNGPLAKIVQQYSEDGKLIREWPSLMEVKRSLGFNAGHICDCCNGKRRIENGFVWKYK